jgi:uncharacterized cupin superfamily protein
MMCAILQHEFVSHPSPGSCAGFAAGTRAHHLVNRTDSDVWYLEVGDRSAGDHGEYPMDVS